MNNPRISLIAAMSDNYVIGKNNKIPWHIPEDFAFFREKTSGHAIIMGRKTFESIGKLLPKRPNIIVTRDTNYKIKDAIMALSIEEALRKAKEVESSEVFICGGEEIYKQTLPIADRIYLTIIHISVEGDTFFPHYENQFTRVTSQKEVNNGTYSFKFVTLEK